MLETKVFPLSYNHVSYTRGWVNLRHPYFVFFCFGMRAGWCTPGLSSYWRTNGTLMPSNTINNHLRYKHTAIRNCPPMSRKSSLIPIIFFSMSNPLRQSDCPFIDSSIAALCGLLRATRPCEYFPSTLMSLSPWLKLPPKLHDVLTCRSHAFGLVFTNFRKLRVSYWHVFVKKNAVCRILVKKWEEPHQKSADSVFSWQNAPSRVPVFFFANKEQCWCGHWWFST